MNFNIDLSSITSEPETLEMRAARAHYNKSVITLNNFLKPFHNFSKEYIPENDFNTMFMTIKKGCVKILEDISFMDSVGIPEGCFQQMIDACTEYVNIFEGFYRARIQRDLYKEDPTQPIHYDYNDNKLKLKSNYYSLKEAVKFEAEYIQILNNNKPLER